MWLTAMLEGGRVALKLPNVKYIYTLKVTDREGYENDMRTFNIADLLATVGSTIVRVVFYTTRAQATDLCRTSIACCVSYITPLSALKYTVAFQNMINLILKAPGSLQIKVQGGTARGST